MINIKDKLVSEKIVSSVKTALVFLIIYVNFLIFKPFLLPVIWAIIIAVALYPLQQKVQVLCKGSIKISSILLIIFALAIIVIPSLMFTGELFESIQQLSIQLDQGSLVIPEPSESIEDWPIIGESIYSTWKLFSVNIDKGLQQFQPHLKHVATWLLSSLSGFVKGFFMLLIAIIIAGVLLINASKCYEIADRIFGKLIGDKGTKVLTNSKTTIISVVSGVIGTVLIQTAIISVGFFVADIQGASLLTLLVLVCAIVQLPLVLVVLPIIIYAYPDMSGVGAGVFIVWMIIGSISDNFLKPMLLGRGMEIPMLIILIGSIGGMMLLGIVGLFIGAVCLALGYELFNNWVFSTVEEE